MGRAKYVYVVMDGAIWLWDLVEDRFAQAIKTLDFHHARDHLWAVANTLHGEDTPEAKAWVHPLLRSLRKGRENRVVRHLQELLQNQSERKPESQELIEREVKFLLNTRNICTTRRWRKRVLHGEVEPSNPWASNYSNV